MYFERSRFVMFTAILAVGGFAAVACKAGTAGDDASQASDPTAGTALADPGTTAGKTSGTNDMPMGTTSSSGTSSTTTLVADAGSDADAAPAIACTSDTGADADCSKAGDCQGACEWAALRLKKGVARDIVACLKSIQTFYCDGEYAKVGACNAAAQKKACKDEAATTLCNQAVAHQDNCADGEAEFGKDECIAYVSGLSAKGREGFQTCLDNHQCALTKGCALPH